VKLVFKSVFGAVAELALLVLPVCRLVGRGKTKCANVGWLNFKIFCAVEKKIKHEALGCRVGKKSAVKFICRPDVSIIVFQFNGCCVVFYACL
jgi:hypothetical protein